MSESTAPLEGTPRHRFLPCETLRVSLLEIEPLVPPGRLLRRALTGETLDLPTATIFAHVVPILSLHQLATLCPGFVEATSEFLRLPVRSLALAYPMEEKSTRPDDAPFIPAIETRLHSPIANLENLERPVYVDQPIDSPPPASDAPLPEITPAHEPLPPPAAATPKEETQEPLPRKLAEIFPNLPTFRRVEDFPPAHQLTTAIDPTTISITVEPQVPTAPHALPEETQEALQALFLTEDTLDLPQVVALCGELPGIESCVLADEDRVLASHNAPDGMDLISLSSHASSMLRSMQEASEKMGIGDIPAVTLHTPKGPLSILQQDRLTLIVLHGKRGFIPGVREKMTATLAELNRSQLQLPAPATQRTLPAR